MSTPPLPSGAQRADGSSVQIGALVPLTRPGWVEAGRHLLAGLELAVREVNDTGGIVGRPLELVVRDSAADPQLAVAAVDELARLGVAALAGEYHSVVARAAAARANALGLPFLCSSAVLDALTEQPTEWVARLAPAQSHGWQIYADFLLSAGHRRIAVAAEASVYWASGARILRDYVAPRGMPIGYLDIPAGADLDTKKTPVNAMYEALREVYPFPDDHRIFLREWPLDSVSQNGLLGSEPARPVFIMQVPHGGSLDAKRTMLQKINAAVVDAFHLPDFAAFLHEHSLETVVINGGILADDHQSVEDQNAVYSNEGAQT